MNPREAELFKFQKYASPITPLQINFHQSLQEVTVPDEVWR